jgi:1-acyl-sn-glycerol-3-phosphate acyltransferase
MNGTVIFFPEGRCFREEGLLGAKRGIGVLTKQFPNVKILPVALSGTYKIKNPLCIFTRPKVRIKIGKAFCLSDKKTELGASMGSATDIAAALMKEIEKHYKQIV